MEAFHVCILHPLAWLDISQLQFPLHTPPRKTVLAEPAGSSAMMLGVVDTFTRECLAREVDTSFASRRVGECAAGGSAMTSGWASKTRRCTAVSKVVALPHQQP